MSRRDGAIAARHEECLEQRHPKKAVRRVRYDWCRCAHYSMIEVKKLRQEIPPGLAAPDHTVPGGTVLSRDAFPGTSCQATIGAVPTGRAGRHFTTASSYPAGLGLERTL